MKVWANTRPHVLPDELRKQNSWPQIPKPIAHKTPGVLAIIYTITADMHFDLTYNWFAAVVAVRFGTLGDVPLRPIRPGHLDRQASIAGRRAVVHTHPHSQREAVIGAKKVHEYLSVYGHTVKAYIPPTATNSLYVSFDHKDGMDAAIRSHPASKVLYIHGQAITIEKAQSRRDCFTLDDVAEPTHYEVHAEDYGHPNTRDPQPTTHRITRADAHMIPQPGDGSRLFHYIAHGLHARPTTQTLRDEVGIFMLEKREFLISDCSINDWIKIIFAAEGEKAIISEYIRCKNNDMCGGYLEIAILAGKRQNQISMSKPHGLGYEWLMSYGCNPDWPSLDILRTNHLHYAASSI